MTVYVATDRMKDYLIEERKIVIQCHLPEHCLLDSDIFSLSSPKNHLSSPGASYLFSLYKFMLSLIPRICHCGADVCTILYAIKFCRYYYLFGVQAIVQAERLKVTS